MEVRRLFGSVPWTSTPSRGMALTEAVALAPIAYLFCANALRHSDASLEARRRSWAPGPFRILWSVIVPMLRPPMVYSSILVFSMSLETLTVPLLYGQPVGITVFSTFLYTNGLQSINPDYGILGAASVIILLVTVRLVAVQAKLLKDAQRFVSVRGQGHPAPSAGPRLDQVGLRARDLYLRRLRRAPAHRRPRLPLLHQDLHPAAVARSASLTMANYQRIFAFPVYVQLHPQQPHRRRRSARSWSASWPARGPRRQALHLPLPRTDRIPGAGPAGHARIIIGIGLFWAFAYCPFGHRGLVQGTLWRADHRLRAAGPA